MLAAGRRKRWIAAAALLAAVTASGCASVPANSGGHRVKGGVATISLVSGSIPTYIFPFTPAQDAAYPNPQGFQILMWRPLYWIGDHNKPGIDYGESLAGPPVYRDGNRTVTITLKSWKWSDGSSLTPANVAFWMGLEFTEKAHYSGYTPGYFPDNVRSVSYDDSARTVTFHLTGPVSPAWFTNNELTQIVPLPAAWDRAKNGAGHCAAEDLAAQKSSCPAVYAYLTGQAGHLSSYATNPLWQVVDGPWRLTSFSSDGHVTMVPNKSYSGPVKPSVTKLQMLPYTSESAVYNALRSGSTLSVGDLPVTDAPEANAQGQPASEPLAPRYTLHAVYIPSVIWAFLDYHNPVLRPVFEQLYFRQALQSTINQPLYIKKALHGYATPTYGPVPLRPATPYISSAEKTNPYPFSIARARRYLTSHGWSIPASGPAVCAHPGTGAGQCGAGIPAGKKLVISMLYPTNSTANAVIAQQWQTDASRAGIQLKLTSQAYQPMVGTMAACSQKTAPSCTWGIGYIEGNLGTGIYPSGEGLLAGGAGFNLGGYSDPVMNKLIKKATTSPSLSSLYAFENYAVKQVPYPFMPTPDWTLHAVASNLRGATPFNVQAIITPQNWYFVK
ncbi:MAG TPA: ABC transporter substrate-binding protein [Streptosporangiaceae bacterium]|nr:ABC transporter substrate-binding protein [Streptosporangiaceae bacterium]